MTGSNLSGEAAGGSKGQYHVDSEVVGFSDHCLAGSVAACLEKSTLADWVAADWVEQSLADSRLVGPVSADG